MPDDTENLQPLKLWAPPLLIEALDAEAERRDLSRSRVAREWLAAGRQAAQSTGAPA